MSPKRTVGWILAPVVVWLYGYSHSAFLISVPVTWLVGSLELFPVPVLSALAFVYGFRLISGVPAAVEKAGRRVKLRDLRWFEAAAIAIALSFFVRLVLFLSYGLRGPGGLEYMVEPGLRFGFYRVVEFLAYQPGAWFQILNWGPIPSVRGAIGIVLVGTTPFVAAALVVGYLAHRATAGVFSSIREEEQNRVNDLVAKAFNSEPFVSAIRTSFPPREDEAEEKAGLSWALASIMERKRVFRSSASVFLTGAASLTVVLMLILLWIAFTLVNDDASGVGLSARRLSGDVRELQRSVTSLSSELSGQPELFENALDLVAAARAHAADVVVPEGNSRDNVVERIDGLAETLRNQSIYNGAQELRRFVNQEGMRFSDWDRWPDLLAVSRKLGELRRQLEVESRLLSELLPRLRSGVDELDEAIARPENRVADLIKRISIGILVISFVAAVLRYTAGLYRHHLEQVIRAEADEFLVRRFFVAAALTEEDADSRRAVLTAFLAGSSSPAEEEGKSGDRDELFKELQSLVSRLRDSAT